MEIRRRYSRKFALLAACTGCLLLTLLAPGWRGLLQALDYANLANCALPNSLNLTARVGDQPSSHTVYIAHNLSPGCDVAAAEPFTASVSALNGGDSWLSVAPASGTLQPTIRNAVRVTFTPAALPGAGAYQGFVHVRVPSIDGTISIPVNAALAPTTPQLSLSVPSMVFQAVTQTGLPATQQLALNNTGAGTLDWSIDSSTIPLWLNITPRSGSLAAGSLPAILTVVPNTIALEPEVYTALISFRSATATNSPQYLAVNYHVVRPTAGAVPVLSGHSLVYRAAAGSTATQEQICVLSNTGGGNLTATIEARTTSGNWLSVFPSVVNAASGSPIPIRATVNPTGLAAGIYRGTITVTPSVRQPQTVEVVLVVTPSGTAISPAAANRGALDGCTPTSMFVIGSSIGNGLNAPVSFPQTLLAQVLDSCGDPVSNATVVATVQGDSIPMSNTGGGLYSGTWSPIQAAPAVNVTMTAFHPVFASVQQTFNVAAITASGGTVLPVLSNDGVVEGAAFTTRRPLMPGGIVSLFGSNLAATTQAATTIPLERRLGQTSVRIGGIEAPLFFVSPGQINAQVPYESRPGEVAAVVVQVGGRITAPQNYIIAPAQPGIFTDPLGPAILDDQFRRISADNPARIGRVIQMFVGGLGDTVPPAASGGSLNVGSDATVPVSVQIGGVDAPVQYDGLAPGFVGLYQVNITVPIVAPGPAVQVILRQNGVPANPNQTITIPVAQ